MSKVNTAGKVIFALEAATVHVISGDVEILPDGSKHEPHESRVLLPGETLLLSEVPSYVVEDLKEGRAAGLSLKSPAQVKRIQRDIELVRGVTSSDILEVEEDDEEDDDE